MALIIKDRVKETTTTTGTGSVTLAGAATGFQTFSSAVGNGNTCYYAIALGSEWETGLGTYTSAGNTLSRDVVLESSNANALVSFSAGSKEVFVTYPAAKSVYADANDTLTESKYVATLNTSGSSDQGAFALGTLSYSDSNTLASFVSSVNAYNQVVIQNTNSGGSASADLTLSNNIGTATTNYANFGINSNGWAGSLGTSSLTAPNVTYLTSTSSDLVIGTTTANKIRLLTNSGADKVIIDGATALVEVAAGTTTQAPLELTAGTNMTTAAAGTVEYDGTTWYFTPATSKRGVVVTESFIATTATKTLANNTAAQSLFAGASGVTNGALSVTGNTSYYFECSLSITAMSGTTGNITFGILGAGTATLTSTAWQAFGFDQSTLTTGNNITGTWQSTASATNPVSAGGGSAVHMLIKGIFRINAAGTIIPSVSLVTAVGTAVVGVNTWFKCYPVGTGSVIAVGDWS